MDQATILRFHQDRIATHGRGTHQALGWKTAAGQRVRFEVLAEIADLNGRSVLDAGCGHGDLRALLGEKFPQVHYLGIDQVSAFLEVATANYGAWPNTTFGLGDFTTAALPTMDYVLASGALSYRSREPDFVFQMITKLYNTARLGFAFNLLRHLENTDGILAAYEPTAILDHCCRLTPKVVLREDYLEDDFTVMMYRER